MIEKKEFNYENTVLIGIVTEKQNADTLKEYLDELEFLSFTAGGKVIQRFIQALATPHPKTFIGSGKMQAVLAYVNENDVSTVIFDDELTPAQQG